MSQEFQKQVDYDYKNRLRSMMRKLSWMLLALLVLAGCGEVVTKEEEKPKVQDVEEVVEEDVGPKEQITWDQDGSKMVLIPAGSFRMGDHLDKMKTALPVHRVELDAFYMDVNEVTVGQFREFVNRSGYNYGVNWDTVAKYSPGVGYPMVYVNWNDATAYAKWAGKRLPTEAEWEYAARGGRVGKRYPWGDGKNVARNYANYNGIGGRDKWDRSTARVGSFRPNGYSLYDMAGNVVEWCADWYSSDYYSKSPAKNPLGPGRGKYRVLRGGNWRFRTNYLRVADRRYHTPLTTRDNFYGFRCVSGLN